MNKQINKTEIDLQHREQTRVCHGSGVGEIGKEDKETQNSNYNIK